VSALAFLSPAAADGDAIARSPMERLARAAGARFEIRDGWNVAVDYEREASGAPVAWADVSHLRKWEVSGASELMTARPELVTAGRDLGTAQREGDAWWCGLTPERTLVVGGPAPEGALDVTCNYAALVILGPNARETIARFCALDLRPDKAPPHSFRPGSIARQPGMLLVEAENRFLLLFGWAVAEYMWTVVADAAKPLGGAPIGVNSLEHA
jgi:glycine cleavage system aminomethyltransferase T